MFSNPPQKLLDVPTLLDIIPVSRPTLSRLTRSGKLKSVGIGRQLFFRRQDVEAFLEACHE